MPHSAGTKVTDPHAIINEPTGLVTSDSLAADSLNNSGSFAANNPHAAASQQPSASTTSNNTDTSGATRLPPAPDAEARDAQAGWQETSQLNAAHGLGSQSSAGGKSSRASGSGEGMTGEYAGAAEQAWNPGERRPHGANITEDPDMTGQTDFGAVGTKMDPGRKAELEFAKRAAMPGGAGGSGKDASSPGGDSKFSGLAREESA